MTTVGASLFPNTDGSPKVEAPVVWRVFASRLVLSVYRGKDLSCRNVRGDNITVDCFDTFV